MGAYENEELSGYCFHTLLQIVSWWSFPPSIIRIKWLILPLWELHPQPKTQDVMPTVEEPVTLFWWLMGIRIIMKQFVHSVKEVTKSYLHDLICISFGPTYNLSEYFTPDYMYMNSLSSLLSPFLSSLHVLPLFASFFPPAIIKRHHKEFTSHCIKFPSVRRRWIWQISGAYTA